MLFRFQIPIPIYRALRSRCMRAGAREGIIAGKTGGITSHHVVSFPILSFFVKPNFARVPTLNRRTDFYAVCFI